MAESSNHSTITAIPTVEQIIEAANNLLAALEGVQCWGGTYVGEKMQELDVLLKASPCSPENACSTHGRCMAHSSEVPPARPRLKGVSYFCPHGLKCGDWPCPDCVKEKHAGTEHVAPEVK